MREAHYGFRTPAFPDLFYTGKRTIMREISIFFILMSEKMWVGELDIFSGTNDKDQFSGFVLSYKKECRYSMFEKTYT